MQTVLEMLISTSLNLGSQDSNISILFRTCDCCRANPGSWGLRTFALTECLSPEWATPSGIDGQTVGEATLDQFGLLHRFYWVWIDFGAMIGFIAIATAISYVALRWLPGELCAGLQCVV